MNLRSTVIGLVVLGLLAAGMIWSRSRSLLPSAAPEGRVASAGATAGAVSVRPGQDDGAWADATMSDAAVDAAGVRITFAIAPRPAVALAGFRVRVRAEANGAPAVIDGGRVSFEMVMPMGDHRYTLVPGEDGWQEAAVVLPT